MSESGGPTASTDPDSVEVDHRGPIGAGRGDSSTGPTRRDRIFGSTAYFRLFVAQVVSATGDWLGLVAITALAARVGGGSPEAAISLVLTARIAPGFFLAPIAGVMVDRWNRKRVMVVCDIGRAAVLVMLPFIDTVLGLVVASLVLEIFTLLWAPAKEASVPNLVPAEHLTAANSLSLVAAYGTFPIAAALFAGLTKVSEALEGFAVLDGLRLNQEGLAFYVDAATFLIAATLIWAIALPVRSRAERRAARGRRFDFDSTFTELKEGWHFAFVNPVVRAVILGLATGLIGGGMLVPLGPVFATEVLGAGEAGFGLFIFSLGLGVAMGVATLSGLQRRVPKGRVFYMAVFVSGASLLAAASVPTLLAAAPLVGLLGVCAGAVYVLGFTLLHENVDDELRGRIFSALYTVVRLCVLIAFAVGPLLAGALDAFSTRAFDGAIEIGAVSVAIPGVRLTLWLAGLIIVGAGVLARHSLQAAVLDPERTVDGLADRT